MNNAYIDFDASNDHIRIDMHGELASSPPPEGIALDTRTTAGGHYWSEEDWQARIDLHLRQADNLARLMGSHVRYNQLWCEQRAKTIGAWHPAPKPCAVHDGPDRENPDAEACGLASTGRVRSGDYTAPACDYHQRHPGLITIGRLFYGTQPHLPARFPA